MKAIVNNSPYQIEAMYDLQNWLIRNEIIDIPDTIGLYDFRRITIEDYVELMEPKIKDQYLKELFRKKKDYYLYHEKHINRVL